MRQHLKNNCNEEGSFASETMSGQQAHAGAIFGLHFTLLRRGSCYKFKLLSLSSASYSRDSGSKGNKWTKERLCGGE